MLEPALPSDEPQRLQSLHNLGLIESLTEERFDRVTRLAARLFNVPIALLSLVDRGRQWFKSRQGIDVCGTDRRMSFCAHAILREGPLVVPDTLRDERFRDNPLVSGSPNIRFYAGHPIHTPDGARIGTLCLVDRRPREFTDADRALLADLAATVDGEIALISLSTIDELTRLSNRRGFNMLAEHLLALCYRQQQVVALASIDLDGFNRINETHGHAVGDDLLRQFSALLLGHFRTSDVVARVGADEFYVLATGASEAQITSSLQRFAATFAASPLHKAHPQLSWSAAVMDFDPAYALDLDALVAAADEKMHHIQLGKQLSPASGKAH